MNNQDKNTYVKRQITNTLLELLKEKELSDINIGEITDKAEVSRNSFYRNYADKEDITLEDAVDALYGECAINLYADSWESDCYGTAILDVDEE